MFHIVSYVTGVTLACYVISQVKKTYRNYPKLKQALAQGDAQARPRFYLQILQFEWVSATLALVALGFDKTKLLASALQLGDSAFSRWVSASEIIGTSSMVGIGAGLVIGLVVMVVVRFRSRRQAPAQQNQHRPRWRKIVPDVGPLIPATPRERWLFAAVALSAGICEEIVFRGWLLFTLHAPLGFTGTTLILLAAVLFGLCHIYQGVTGVVGATAAGVILSAFYIGTGSLLLPIVLHALIDLRAAILPAGRSEASPTQPEPA